jgi:hypothetical protein
MIPGYAALNELPDQQRAREALLDCDWPRATAIATNSFPSVDVLEHNC